MNHPPTKCPKCGCTEFIKMSMIKAWACLQCDWGTWQKEGKGEMGKDGSGSSDCHVKTEYNKEAREAKVPIFKNFDPHIRKITGSVIADSEGFRVMFIHAKTKEEIFKIFGNIAFQIVRKEEIDGYEVIKEFIIVSWGEVYI